MSLIPTASPCYSTTLINTTNATCSDVEEFFYSPAGLAVSAAAGILVSSLFWLCLFITCCCCCCCCRRSKTNASYDTQDSGATIETSDLRYLSMGRNKATLTRMFRMRTNNVVDLSQSTSDTRELTNISSGYSEMDDFDPWNSFRVRVVCTVTYVPVGVILQPVCAVTCWCHFCRQCVQLPVGVLFAASVCVCCTCHMYSTVCLGVMCTHNVWLCVYVQTCTSVNAEPSTFGNNTRMAIVERSMRVVYGVYYPLS